MIIERLRGVIIEHENALDIIEKYDSKDTLFYADPPYLTAVRDKGSDYRYELNEGDHIRLAELLCAVKGKALVSGYHSALYEGLYQGWEVRERETYADRALPRTEVLWIKGMEKELFSDGYDEQILFGEVV
jgi:DNA adenine methylase